MDPPSRKGCGPSLKNSSSGLWGATLLSPELGLVARVHAQHGREHPELRRLGRREPPRAPLELGRQRAQSGGSLADEGLMH